MDKDPGKSDSVSTAKLPYVKPTLVHIDIPNHTGGKFNITGVETTTFLPTPDAGPS